MRIALAYRQDVRANKPVTCYASCVRDELELCGYQVVCAGENHDIPHISQLDQNDFDFLLEIDNGRNLKGDLPFQQPEVRWSIPNAVWFIDSHGNPTLHKRLAGQWQHVFFAVWFRRDLFLKHPKAHWCPNATDLHWFNYKDQSLIEKQFDFGFFGSKGGLSRADKLKEVCEKNGWSYDIRQISKTGRHKWPMCSAAMAACHNLFNRSQKHDGPNQRVMESMAMRRPLLCDSTDPGDGMAKLFVEGYHYVGYNGFTYEDLEEKCKWILDNPDEAERIAINGYNEVKQKHTIHNRVNQILDTVGI